MHSTYFRIAGALCCVATLVAAVYACGGTTSSGPGTSGEGGAGEGGSSGGLSSSCPAAAPADHATCVGATTGLECEYGSDPALDCNTTARCDGSAWIVSGPAGGAACPTVRAAVCPASPTATPGAVCSSQGTQCTYATGACVCAQDCGPRYPVAQTCDASTPLTWICNTTQMGCPAERPHLGATCAQAGQDCSYVQEPCEDSSFVCKDGTWHVAPRMPCPISTAKAKEEIHYLSDAELEEVRAETNALRLTTYRYRQGDPAQHLGFIIEDAPQSPAVLQGKDRIDLYGYTSMAVATLQMQERELAELRRDVSDLKKQLAARSLACPAAPAPHPGDKPERP